MSADNSFNFVSNCEVELKNLDLEHLLEITKQCNNHAEIIKSIDILIGRYQKGDLGCRRNFIRDALLIFFTRISPNKNLERYLYEKLVGLKIGEKTFFEVITESLIEENSIFIETKIVNVRFCHHVLSFFACFIDCLESSKYAGYLKTTFPFYKFILELFSSQFKQTTFTKNGSKERFFAQDEDCCSILSVALTQLNNTAPKAFEDDGYVSCPVKMISYTHGILRYHQQLNYDIVSKCGQLMTFYLKHLPDEERTFLKWKNAPILDFVDNANNNYSIVLSEEKFENVFTSEQMRIILNLAIFTSVDSNTLVELQVFKRPLLEHLFINTVTLGMKMTNYPEQIVQITHTIETMSKALHQLPNYADVFSAALEFCWSHLDHFIDNVILYTRKVFAVLVQQAANYYLKEEPMYLEKIFEKLSVFGDYNVIRIEALFVICKNLDYDILIRFCRGLQTQLLAFIGNGQHAQLCAEMYTTLMVNKMDKLPDKDVFRFWICPILSMLRKENIKSVDIYSKIAINAFILRPGVFSSLFDVTSDVSTYEYNIVLNCLHHARKNSITIPRDGEYSEGYLWRGLVPKSKLLYFMIHHDDTVRIKTLQVVAECQKTTEVFEGWEFTFLKKFYETNISSQNASFRSQFVTYYRKILTRFEATYTNLQKQPEENKLILGRYDSFLYYMTNESLLYLTPDANYSRKSVSLQLLLALKYILQSRGFRIYLNEDKVNNLKNIINDGYEANKVMAVLLLSCLPPDLIGFDSKEVTFDYYKKCIQMVTDIRPSQSLSACFMFQMVLHSPHDFKRYSTSSTDLTDDKQALLTIALIEEMEMMFKEKPTEIAEAAKTSPLYGLLFSVVLLLRNRKKQLINNVYSSIFSRLIKFCLKIKTHVMPVVCALSPEGNLPDFEDGDNSFLETDQSSKAQMILVYAWKTIKNVMVALAEIVKQTVELEKSHSMLDDETLLEIGEFLMDVFKQSKHRGVFEQAHVAFSIICKYFTISTNAKLKLYPLKCLQEAIDLCTGKKTDERLISTRRSAGLPFLILSIIPTVTDVSKNNLKNTIVPLLALTSALTEQNPELTMHCFNVLRFMFNNSKLSDSLALWLDRGTIAALQGYKSPTWGIRNSATLLLSTLLLKIFGVPPMTYEELKQSRPMTFAMFYVKFKRLMNFLLKTLQDEGHKTDSLIIYPVLLILARLFPIHCDSINSQVKSYIPLVNYSIKNPSYRTRDVAARASISLMSTKSLEQRLTDIFSRIASEEVTDVECHGLLLQARHIFQTVDFDTLLLPVYFRETYQILGQAGRRFSHQTVTLYMEIVFMLLAKYKLYSDKPILRKMLELLVKRDNLSNITTSGSAFAWYRFQLILYILINKFKHVESTYKLITNIITQHLYSRDLETLRRCLHFLIYFNQITADGNFTLHPLFEAKEIEISPIIRALAHSIHIRCRKEFLYYTHSYLIRFFNIILQQNLDLLGDCQVLVFLLLSFYPCFFKMTNIDVKKSIWNTFISMANGNKNEDVISAIITCLKVFMKSCTGSEIAQLDFKALLVLLMKSAVPEAADYRRLATAQFITDSGLYNKEQHVSEYHRYNVFNIIMVLLEDDEDIVRDIMCMRLSAHHVTLELAIKKSSRPLYFTAHKARELLFKLTFSEFSNEMAICILSSWAIRRLPEATSGASEVYERGEANLYAENVPITFSAGRILCHQLWKSVPQDVANKNYSILKEEQALQITIVVLNSLIKYPSPMVNAKTKSTVIISLENIRKFLETIKVGRKDFNRKFQEFFITHILVLLQNTLDTDYSAVKAFFMYLYEPIIVIPVMSY